MTAETTTKPFIWSLPDLPRKGWRCATVLDYGEENYQTCEMCGNPRVRYIHRMTHAEYTGQLSVGCVCAEHMENDYVNPRKREGKLRYKAVAHKRRQKKLAREKEKVLDALRGCVWRGLSNHRGRYLHNPQSRRRPLDLYVIVIKSKFNDSWGFGLNGVYSNYKYPTEQAALVAAKAAVLGHVDRLFQQKAAANDTYYGIQS